MTLFSFYNGDALVETYERTEGRKGFSFAREFTGMCAML